MIDELKSLSLITSFSVLLLREPSGQYVKDLIEIETNGVKILEGAFTARQILQKIPIVFKYVVKNFRNFLSYYNFVIGVGALWRYLLFDDVLLGNPLSIHAQFATQAAIFADILHYARNGSVTYCFTFHAYDIYFHNRWFKTLVNNCDSAFSISEYNVSYVLQHYHGVQNDKLILSRLGAKPPDMVYLDKSQVTIVFGFLSWFVEKKGLKYLLEAFCSEKVANLNVELKIGGDGPLKNYVTGYIEQFDKFNKINCLGPIYGDSKEEFFRSIDVFILPSITLKKDMDGIPVVLMEAISMGIPIISTNVSGIPEICKNEVDGLLIPEKNTNAIIESVKYLVENKVKLADFSAGALKVYNEFNIDKNTKKKMKLMKWMTENE